MMDVPGMQAQKRPFWTKPEGVTGIATLALIAGLGVLGINVFGPSILSALTILVSLIGKAYVVAALAVFGWLAFMVGTNKKVHALVEYMFKTSMRKLTGMVVEIDPIGIMKSYISDLKAKRSEMAEYIRKLNGQYQIVKEKITANKKGAEQALKMAKVARDRGNTAQLTINSKQHDRLERYTVSLEEVSKKIEVLLSALRKYYEAAEAVIADLQNEVEIQEDQRKTMFAAYGAINAIREVFSGEGDKREIFDMAMELVKDQYGQKLGEIEDFMTMSHSFIDGMDMQNGVVTEDALKKIEEWEKKVDSVLLGDNKRQMLEKANANLTPFGSSINVDPMAADYSKLFNR